jgi:putative NADH-flavin reductase
MERKYITVFGATGRIGTSLLQFLSSAGVPAIAVTRNKNKAVPMPFVEWMEADMNDKESLYQTMMESKAVFHRSVRTYREYFITRREPWRLL